MVISHYNWKLLCNVYIVSVIININNHKQCKFIISIFYILRVLFIELIHIMWRFVYVDYEH